MGISLTGLTPSTTYDALIKVGDNGPIDGTLKTLSDGLGNDLPMEVSTTGVNFTNNLTQGGTALQPVLVSGTNIKTINGASLLGSGNIPVVTSPSGVSGAIQFSNGSAFASDAANFFWDDTNKRLGIGTNAPTTALQINYSSSTLNGLLINQTGSTGNFSNIGFANGGTIRSTFGMNLNTGEVRWFNASGGYFATIYANNVEAMRIDGSQNVNIGATALGARVGIRGSGSTSATTSLLVQNSAGTTALQVQDNLNTTLGGSLTIPNFQGILSGTNDIYFQTFRTVFGATFNTIAGQYAFLFDDGGGNNTVTSGTLGRFAINSRFAPTSGTAVYNTALINPTINQTGSANGITRGLYINPTLTAAADFRAIEASNGGAYINTTSVQASAILQADSTTKGFLPPRMTTTQKNAIASPAAGLVLYDSTTNKLQCYNGSTWNDLF